MLRCVHYCVTRKPSQRNKDVDRPHLTANIVQSLQQIHIKDTWHTSKNGDKAAPPAVTANKSLYHKFKEDVSHALYDVMAPEELDAHLKSMLASTANTSEVTIGWLTCGMIERSAAPHTQQNTSSVRTKVQPLGRNP